MKLIVGLGNPGKEYDGTRHNIGFAVVDELRRRHDLPFPSEKFKGLLMKGRVADADVLLFEPQTYMNLSGDAVIEAVQFYKVDAKNDLIVVHDDLDLPLGELRVQKNASSAGHNGVKSVIERLGTQDFTRVRVGIGRPSDRTPVEDYVVMGFTEEEEPAAEDAVLKAADEIEKLLP